MDSLGSCSTCKGLGPVPRWVIDARGETVPIPFEPCVECGLDWPTQSSPLPSAPLLARPTRRRPARPEPLTYGCSVICEPMVALAA